MERKTYGRRAVLAAILAAAASWGAFGRGELAREVSAQKKQPIYPNKDAFATSCRNLGGTYVDGGHAVWCHLPNGHTVICDENFDHCSLIVPDPTPETSTSGGGPVKGDVVDGVTTAGVLDAAQDRRPARPRVDAAITPVSASD